LDACEHGANPPIFRALPCGTRGAPDKTLIVSGKA
jgi:hypothetical protein